MSYYPGTDCGGVRSLSDIKSRCHVCEETGCWEWGMSFSDKGVPRTHVAPGALRSTRLTTSAYRAAYLLAGKRPKKGDLIFRSCRNPKCCNPAHCKAMTQKEMGAEIAAMGYLKGNPQRKIINARNITNRTPVEVVRRIEAMLAEGVLHRDVSAATGIHKSTVSTISQGKHVHSAGRQKVIAGASVFQWTGQIAVNDDEAKAA